MKSKTVHILSLIALLSSTLYIKVNPFVVNAPEGVQVPQKCGVVMLWNNSMAVSDIAVSRDGNYIAAVNSTGIYYFAWNDSSPRWWYKTADNTTYFMSTALSADGNYVVVGDNNGHIYYFNDSKATIDERLFPTWVSMSMGGMVERGTLDMSDDGEDVVLGGTGITMYYYANCGTRSNSSESPTWSDYLPVYDIRAVHISPNGRYVATGGTHSYGNTGFVAFYADANNVTSPPTNPIWFSESSLTSVIIDLAMSDDGYAVAAIDSGPTTLCYWANATVLTGDPNATWTNPGTFGSVDMSADGNSVVACGQSYLTLHFWGDARTRQGVQQEDWIRLQTENVLDVAISDDGNFIAAPTETLTLTYNAYFYKSDGTMMDKLGLLQLSQLVSMSGNGRIAAMGGFGLDSLYVFKIIEDSTPPLIEGVYQQPTNDTVHPDDKVIVYANVTDDESGVKQVTLNYTINDNGTWFIVEMANLQENVYNATISPFPYCTNVTYIIIAEDNFNNTITTQDMQLALKYHVIPELPTSLVIPLFMVATLFTVMLFRKKTFVRTKAKT